MQDAQKKAGAIWSVMLARSVRRPCAVLLAVCALAAGGCHSTPASRAPARKEPPPPAPKPSTAAAWPAEKLAQAHAHYAAGVIHEMNQETEAALQDYYQAAMNDPDNETLILEVTRKFLQNKQPEKALELLTHAAGRPNASGAIYARLGLVYLQLGKSEQAVTANRVAIKRSPETLAGYQNLFLTHIQNKQEAEALKVLDEAAKQSHADADFLVGLAELYTSYMLQVPAQKAQVQPKALAVLNRAAKLKPSSAPLRLRMADDFKSMGDSTNAAQIYLDLLKQLPDMPILRERVHADLAEIYLRSSDHKRATEQLEAIIHDEPTNPQAYYYLGTLAFEDKKPANAADYFSKTILLSPEFEPAYYELARAQITLNKTSEALSTLDKARKRFPQNFILEFWSGLAYSRQKAYTEALPHYTAAEVIAKATNPKLLDHLFYFQLGAAYERTGDFAQAETYFKKCLEMEPKFAEAQNYLGYMWAEHGMKLAEARELIEKALKAEPKNAAYLDSLGWVLFKLNQPKEALEYIQKAISLLEEPDATVYDHLGDIYAALKQPEKAQEAWTKSLSLESSDLVRKKLGSAAPPETKKPDPEASKKQD
jgi:tetratricopeptide (TPR) repeat protein